MYDCDKCSANFFQKYDLNRHALTHTDLRFECRVCKTQFKYKSNLRRHEKNTHHIISDTREPHSTSTSYNNVSSASPSVSINSVDLTGISDDEGISNDVTNDVTNLQQLNNQGYIISIPSNINSINNERIYQQKTISYTLPCNLNGNSDSSITCLCGLCTTVDIKTENEISNTKIVNTPTSSRVVDSTVNKRMAIKRTAPEVKLNRKNKKCKISKEKPLTLSALDSHIFPEERYRMAKEYIIEQHKKIYQYEKTIKNLEDCIGIMNAELIRYKNEYKNKNTKN